MNAFAREFHSFIRSTGPGSKLRLAPTPSGYLHAGNALNLLLNWLAARYHSDTRLLLRIDDLDAGRKRPEYVQDVFDTLHWLGLDWDEGPTDTADFEAAWSQQHRLPLYRNALNHLRLKGWLFACGKSRSELGPFGINYPVSFREQGLNLDQPDISWRIRTPDAFPLSDFVVRRRDGIPAYQIASLVDDLHFKITHIIRGKDLEESTIAQQYLSNCLEERAFDEIRFLHHPLLFAADGAKLSKSAGAAALRTRRLEMGTPDYLFDEAAHWIGLPESGFGSAQELLQALRNLG